MTYLTGLLNKVSDFSVRALMINSTTRLGKNKRKKYKWLGKDLLDQLRYNKRKCLAAGPVLICTE